MPCLRECAGVILSFKPWEYRSGPVNLLLERGYARIVEHCPPGVDVIDCDGLVAAPCPFDALYTAWRLPGDDSWFDELFEQPVEVSEEVVGERARLGFCGLLAYGTVSSGVEGFTAIGAGTIVKPDGSIVELGEGPVIAAVSVSRKSVYTLRSRRGRFPVDWLHEKGLLSSRTVVVGSWVASWEVERMREKGALLALAPIAQALYRGGPPPRPQYEGVVALASAGVRESPWMLAYAALLEYSSVYWGSKPVEELLEALVRGWRLAGREPRLGSVPVALLEVEFDGTPLDFILSKPVHRLSVTGVDSGGVEGEAG